MIIDNNLAEFSKAPGLQILSLESMLRLLIWNLGLRMRGLWLEQFLKNWISNIWIFSKIPQGLHCWLKFVPVQMSINAGQDGDGHQRASSECSLHHGSQQ